MNKQQLASKIWESAQEMRDNIESNDYKDYILGFIFYRFLSFKEVQFLHSQKFTDEQIKKIDEKDEQTVNYIKNNLGYFIEYKNLYTTWIDPDFDFDISNVTDALNAFNRLIDENHKKNYIGIFDTLQLDLTKLSGSPAQKTATILKILNLIKDIPMDDKQGYDVLGYIYEYLIENFASNAGKKAGEFYTPHEVSLLMSEVIAEHLKHKSEINIYDPTSGSASLLINIGKSIGKYMKNDDGIKYFAQEYIPSTYNLTRMNLLMRGILPDNIIARNGDTLADDWPYFEEEDKRKTYKRVYADAVVSNPPYSKKWDSKNRELDARFHEYGIAPKSKADYAFLLHALYHIKDDGICAIVLPHGVLFRGGDEGKIRKNLVENNNIDTIIGLPSNIFYGTGIPTIIMLLRKNKTDSNILLINASSGFVKEGKKNKLRERDIKKAYDTIINREEIKGYSKIVTREQVRENKYNLNITRYFEKEKDKSVCDLYASMFGGIPNYEIDYLNKYWKNFPNLKTSIFKKNNEDYSDLNIEDVDAFIDSHNDISNYNAKFETDFNNFDDYLKKQLFDFDKKENAQSIREKISKEIFGRITEDGLLDKYSAYQIFMDNWKNIEIDLEYIYQEGLETCKIVDPVYVTKEDKNGNKVEIQDGWKGHVIPFDLINNKYFINELNEINNYIKRLDEINSYYNDTINSFNEEDDDMSILNDDNSAFVSKEVNRKVKEILSEIETDEINVLNDYVSLIDNKNPKADKLKFIEDNKETIKWDSIKQLKDGTYGKKDVLNYIASIQMSYEFPNDSYEYKVTNVFKLMNEEKDINKTIKERNNKLIELDCQKIPTLNNEEIIELLEEKWILPICNSINLMPYEIENSLKLDLKALINKYDITYENIEHDIKESADNLKYMLEDLNGNEYDNQAINELNKLLCGEEHE